jgi:hypothetical protein
MATTGIVTGMAPAAVLLCFRVWGASPPPEKMKLKEGARLVLALLYGIFVLYYTVSCECEGYCIIHCTDGIIMYVCMSVTFIQVGPPGYFVYVSITTPIVSALKNYYR